MCAYYVEEMDIQRDNSREGTIVFHRIFGLPWGD